MAVESLEQFRRGHARTLARLYARIRDKRWKPTEADFVAVLYRSVVSHFRFPLRAGRGEIERYLGSLHVEDLALACACERGSQSAWLHFVTDRRPAVNETILAFTGDPSRAREMADLLDRELHGAQPDGNPRPSLLQHFQGRSSLLTWLCAVIARVHCDRRWGAKSPAAPDATPQEAIPTSGNEESPADAERVRQQERLHESVGRALLKLSPRDRLRLSLFHADRLSPTQIARLLREKEPQVLRRLRHTHRQLRKGLDREPLRSPA